MFRSITECFPRLFSKVTLYVLVLKTISKLKFFLNVRLNAEDNVILQTVVFIHINILLYVDSLSILYYEGQSSLMLIEIIEAKVKQKYCI